MKIENLLIEINDAERLAFENPIKVAHDFKPDALMGIANVTVKDGKMYADIEINLSLAAVKNLPINSLTPAIGYDGKKRGEDGSIPDGKLHWVALCTSNNVDPRIKTIGEQIAENQAT